MAGWHQSSLGRRLTLAVDQVNYLLKYSVHSLNQMLPAMNHGQGHGHGQGPIGFHNHLASTANQLIHFATAADSRCLIRAPILTYTPMLNVISRTRGLLISSRLSDLRLSLYEAYGGRIQEHLTEQSKSRISVISEVSVTICPARYLPLNAWIL